MSHSSSNYSPLFAEINLNHPPDSVTIRLPHSSTNANDGRHFIFRPTGGREERPLEADYKPDSLPFRYFLERSTIEKTMRDVTFLPEENEIRWFHRIIAPLDANKIVLLTEDLPSA